MANQSLDDAFLALADPTRRRVLATLATGPATVSELAASGDIALPSFLKHINLLERAGWIRTVKRGRVRTCTLEAGAYATVDGWLADQKAIWESRTDRLQQALKEEDE